MFLTILAHETFPDVSSPIHPAWIGLKPEKQALSIPSVIHIREKSIKHYLAVERSCITIQTSYLSENPTIRQHFLLDGWKEEIHWVA